MATTTLLTLDSRATRTDDRDVVIDGIPYLITEFADLTLREQKAVETHINDIVDILAAFEQSPATADDLKLTDASDGIEATMTLLLPDLDLSTTEISDLQKIEVIQAIIGRTIIPSRA